MHRIFVLIVLLLLDHVISSHFIYSGHFSRFTVLSSHIIRMEWHPKGLFRDDPTTVFTTRDAGPAVPPFYVKQNATHTIIETSALRLEHRLKSIVSFNQDNLAIHLKTRHFNNTVWHPGDEQNNTGRLLGTVRTLDGKTGAINLDCDTTTPAFRKSSHCTYGLFNRKTGYVVLDDTLSHTLTTSHQDTSTLSKWPWIYPTRHSLHGSCNISNHRVCGANTVVTKKQCIDSGCCYEENNCFYSSEAPQDLYFMGHGLNYKLALQEFTSIAGNIPLLPSYVFGIFSSRYWAYSDADFQHQVIDQYHQRNIPLSVLVLDMDWHLTFYANQTTDSANQRKGWTGYTWNKSLFPSPESFLHHLHSQHIKASLNIHPASGIQPWEDTFDEMKNAVGLNGTYIPFHVANQTFVENWMNITIAKRESEGVDFWWIDWQQGEDWMENHGEAGLFHVNPTFWLNHVFYTRPRTLEQSPSPPLIMSRWGGLGNHRYPIGFSGDVAVSWESLAFQPKFTSTAANVGFAYWSHDIGGHAGKHSNDAELFTRWVQWGVFSPIFRTHCTKDSHFSRNIWDFDTRTYEITRRAMEWRNSLVPYIYTASYHTHVTGLALVYGLYIDYPELDEAYRTSDRQYKFGKDMMICPVTSKGNTVTGLANVSVWIPPKSSWVEWMSGNVYDSSSSSTVVQLDYALDEIPVFVKAGSIIPMRFEEKLCFNVFPTTQPRVSSGKTLLEGVNEFLSFESVFDNNEFKFTIMPSSLHYAEKSFVITLHNTYLLSNSCSITITMMNNSTIPLRNDGGDDDNYWKYDGSKLAIEIHINKYDVRNCSVRVSGVSRVRSNIGYVKMARRLHHVKRLLDEQWNTGDGHHTVYMGDYPTLLMLSEADVRMTQDPFSVKQELLQFERHFKVAQAEVNNLRALLPNVKAKCLALLNATSTNIIHTKSEPNTVIFPIILCVIVLLAILLQITTRRRLERGNYRLVQFS